MVSKIKQILLAVGIMVIFNFFVFYGIEAFYDSPEYQDFCPDRPFPVMNETQETCESAGGYWNPPMCPSGEKCQGYCDMYYKCQKEFDAARKPYERNVFVISMVIGILTILVSLFLPLESVSSGFMAGGVIVLIVGVIRYWNDLNEVLRFVILGIVLAILVWIGYRKLNPKLEQSEKAPPQERPVKSRKR